MREADFGEAGGAGKIFDLLFVRRVGVAVEQADGERFDVFDFEAGQFLVNLCFGGRLKDAAVGSDPFVDLGDGRKKRLGLVDVQLKELGPVLVADAQNVGEAAGGNEGRLRRGG